LRRVDEDRHHDTRRAPARKPHERKMPGVQRAHGRHERDRFAGRPPPRHVPPQPGELVHHRRPAFSRLHFRASVDVGGQI
jgi:hypothetical protein